MHKRRAILEALKTKLQAVSGYSGVFIQRVPPAVQYPCITLASEAEAVDTLTIHAPARPQDRTLTVSVKAWILGTPDDEKPESDMDAAALDIEGAMTKPTGASDITLVSTDFQISEDEPEIHAVVLTFSVSYQTTEFSPT